MHVQLQAAAGRVRVFVQSDGEPAGRLAPELLEDLPADLRRDVDAWAAASWAAVRHAYPTDRAFGELVDTRLAPEDLEAMDARLLQAWGPGVRLQRYAAGEEAFTPPSRSAWRPSAAQPTVWWVGGPESACFDLAADVEAVGLQSGPYASIAAGDLRGRTGVQWAAEALRTAQPRAADPVATTAEAVDEAVPRRLDPTTGREVLAVMLTRWMAYSSLSPLPRALAVQRLVEAVWRYLGDTPAVRTGGYWTDADDRLALSGGSRGWSRGLVSSTFDLGWLAEGRGRAVLVVVEDED